MAVRPNVAPLKYGTPGAISFDKSGVTHAFRFTGARESYCGWTRFNFHKLVDMQAYEYSNGYTYTPPTDVIVTCMHCMVLAWR